MVQINVTELRRKLEMTHAGQCTPLLNAMCESLAWPILSRGVHELIKGLRTHIYNVGDGENYLTSVACSQNDPGWIALGSAQRRQDKKYYLYFIRDLVAADMVTGIGPRFELIQTEKLDIPIHSIDWSGPHILVGSKHGLTRLYTLRQDGDRRRLVLVAEYKAPADQLAFLNGPMYVQGQYPMNSMIKRIQFAPNYSADYVYQQWQPLGNLPVPEHREMTAAVSSQFLTTLCNYVNIWDTVVEDAPINSIKVHGERLNCASWSLHAPHSLIVAGGCAKSLHIIDVRSNRTVWVASDAHNRAIRDAKFNTFIPYWLASGGEDGVVNVFDIRATHHAPVAKLTGHEGVVESLSWSNMRPENLATTSGDGTFRMWMLSKDAVPVSEAYYRTTKWTKKDTPPASLRPDERYLRQNLWRHPKSLSAPWAKMNMHYFYEDSDDPWGHSLNLEPETMLLTGGVGVGEWGRSDKGPVYVGEDIEKSKGPVVQVRMSRMRLADYYCITERGQLCVQSIRIEDGDNIKYRFKFNKNQDPVARHIEYCIYTRKITQAHEALEKLKSMVIEDEEKDKQRREQVDYFEDCLKIRDAIQPDAWGIDTLPNDEECKRRLWTPQDRWDLAVLVFQKELEYWSHRLPPNYATQHRFDLDIKEEAPLYTVTTPPDNNTPSVHSEGEMTPRSLSLSSLQTPSPEDESATNMFNAEGDTMAQLSPSTSHRSLSTLSRWSSAGDDESVTSQKSGLSSLVNRGKTLRRMFSRHSVKSDKSSSIDKSEQEENGVLNEMPVPLTKQRSTRRNALFSPS